MSFMKNISAIFRGKKVEKEERLINENKISEAPSSLDNLLVGSYITFDYLPLHPMLSGNTFCITGFRIFELNDHNTIEYAELDNGIFYLRKEGRKIEILTDYEDNDAFIENVNFEQFNEVLRLEDDEVQEDENGDGFIVDNQNSFMMNKSLNFALEGNYRVINDVLMAKLDGEQVRFIRAKLGNGKSFISVFYKDGGDTTISSSCILEPESAEFYI